MTNRAQWVDLFGQEQVDEWDAADEIKRAYRREAHWYRFMAGIVGLAMVLAVLWFAGIL